MHEKQNLTPRISDLWILIETNWLGGISKNYESKLEEKFRVRDCNVWIGLAKAQSQLVRWTLYNKPNWQKYEILLEKFEPLVDLEPKQWKKQWQVCKD